jgi:hypothetical protein
MTNILNTEILNTEGVLYNRLYQPMARQLENDSVSHQKM